jgi:hypothetical protein
VPSFAAKASLLSSIAADALTSALAIVPSRIFPVVTAPVAIVTVVAELPNVAVASPARVSPSSTLAPG